MTEFEAQSRQHASEDKHRTRNAWISATFGGFLLVALIIIFFARPELSNDQRGLAKFFIALSGAMCAFFFAGTLDVVGKYLGFAVRTGSGFAVFFTMYFLVDPFAQKDGSGGSGELLSASNADVYRTQILLKQLKRYDGPTDGISNDELVVAIDSFMEDFEFLQEYTASALPQGSPSTTQHDVDTSVEAQAIAWIARSVEYEAITRSVYRSLVDEVQHSLNDLTVSALAPELAVGTIVDKPPAVIFDLDGSVFNAAEFQARSALLGGFDMVRWESYVLGNVISPVPGSVAAAQSLRAMGVEVFFVSGRTANLFSATISNLRAIGMPVSETGSNVKFRVSGRQKYELFQEIGQKHRVVAIVGDDFTDFIGRNGMNSAELHVLADKYQNWIGAKWFMLPNPMFGNFASNIQKSIDIDLQNAMMKTLQEIAGGS